MSKKKSKGKGQGQSEGGSEASQAETTTRKSRVVKSLVERLVVKAEVIVAKAHEVAVAAAKRGVPEITAKLTREFVPLAEAYRAAFHELRTSGWAPSAQAETILIEEGSKVSIKPESKSMYAYIPGILDGTAKLVVVKVLQSGKRVQALVTTEDGQPCGYIPRSHLVLR